MHTFEINASHAPNGLPDEHGVEQTDIRPASRGHEPSRGDTIMRSRPSAARVTVAEESPSITEDARHNRRHLPKAGTLIKSVLLLAGGMAGGGALNRFLPFPSAARSPDAYPRYGKMAVHPALYDRVGQALAVAHTYPGAAETFGFLVHAEPNLDGRRLTVESLDNSAECPADMYSQPDNRICIDLSSKEVVNNSTTSDDVGVTSAFKRFLHEASHAEGALRCPLQHAFLELCPHPDFDSLEEKRVIEKVDRDLRGKPGESVRVDHHFSQKFPARTITDTSPGDIPMFKNATMLKAFKKSLDRGRTYYTRNNTDDYAYSLSLALKQASGAFGVQNHLRYILPKEVSSAQISIWMDFFERGLKTTFRYAEARTNFSVPGDVKHLFEDYVRDAVAYSESLCNPASKSAVAPAPQMLPHVDEPQVSDSASLPAPAPEPRHRKLLANASAPRNTRG